MRAKKTILKDGEDPFFRLMDFLDNKTPYSREVSKKLERIWDALIYNAIVAAYFMVFFAIMGVLVSSFLLPLDNPSLRNMGAFFHVFSGILHLCHQLPYRSFIIDGVPMAVCARDTGIYLGFLAGSLYVLISNKPKIVDSIKLPILATIPITLDGVTQTVLLLRESNNILRILTGFIFAFGIVVYSLNKAFKWKPKFIELAVDSRIILADALVGALVVVLLSSYTLPALGIDYMGKNQALDAALQFSRLGDVEYMHVFYVPSATPLSASLDPFYGRNRDEVLDDIRDMEWTKKMVERFEAADVLNVSDNENITEIIGEISEKEHRFGIWAVALLSELDGGYSKSYINGGRGEFHYFDAATGKLIQTRVR
jgi:uncharacterized membrane protein